MKFKILDFDHTPLISAAASKGNLITSSPLNQLIIFTFECFLFIYFFLPEIFVLLFFPLSFRRVFLVFLQQRHGGVVLPGAG